MNEKTSKRQEALINRIMTVFILACVFACALIIVGKNSDLWLISVASKMPWVMIPTAICAVALYVAEHFAAKKADKKEYSEKTFTFGYFAGIVTFLFICELIPLFSVTTYIIQINDVMSCIFILLCVAVLLYTVKLAYKPEFFAFALLSCAAFCEVYAVRFVHSAAFSLKFTLALAVCVLINIAFVVIMLTAKKNKGKLFGKKLFSKSFRVLPFITAFAVSIVALGVYAFFPATFLYCLIACALQFFAVGIYETVIAK